MVREVRGPGTLVPEHIRFITALAAGRVDRVLAQPGQHVKPETVLLDLSNPDVQIQALQAEQQLAAARAELVSQHTNLENQRLTQTGLVATTRTEYLNAKREAEVAESLGAHGGMSRNEAALARDKAVEFETRYSIDQRHRGGGRGARGHGSGGATRPECGRDDRDRAAGARALHRPAGLRPAQQHDRDVQAHR